MYYREGDGNMKKKILDILFWTIVTPFLMVIAVFGIKFIFYLILIGLQFTNMLFGAEYEQRYLYQFEIESMKDSHTYVTTRHSGESELRYYFIREMDGALHSGSTDASESSIVEDGDNIVKVYTKVPKVGTDFYIFMDKLASFDGNPMASKEYVYHIPEDSVETGEYNIDLE